MLKRKQLIAVATLSLAILLSACSKKTDDTAANDATMHTREDKSEQTEATEEVTETEELEVPDFTPYPNEYYVSNGYYYFTAYSDDERNESVYVYDIEKNEVVASAEKSELKEYYSIYFTSVIRYNEENSSTELYDFASDKVLYTFTDSQMSEWAINMNKDGQMPVFDIEEKFEGDIYSFGILDNQGNWIVPSSSDYPWVKGYDSDVEVCYLGEGIYLIEDKWDANGETNTLWYFLNSNNQSYVTADYTHETWYADLRKVFACRNGKVYVQEHVSDGKSEPRDIICQYDTTTGAVTEIHAVNGKNDIGGLGYGLNTTFRDRIMPGQNGWAAINSPETRDVYIVVDDGRTAEFNANICESDFDIDLTDGISIAAKMENESSRDYFGILNADGSYELEPVLLKDEGILTIYGTAITKDIAIVYDNGNKTCISYDRATQEQTIANGYEVLLVDKEHGQILVRGTHPEYGSGCYFVDIHDINTLINPLE